MKTVIATNHNPLNIRLVLIIIGVVIALISFLALILETQATLPSFGQAMNSWVTSATNHTSQLLHSALVAIQKN